MVRPQKPTPIGQKPSVMCWKHGQLLRQGQELKRRVKFQNLWHRILDSLASLISWLRRFPISMSMLKNSADVREEKKRGKLRGFQGGEEASIGMDTWQGYRLKPRRQLKRQKLKWKWARRKR